MYQDPIDYTSVLIGAKLTSVSTQRATVSNQSGIGEALGPLTKLLAEALGFSGAKKVLTKAKQSVPSRAPKTGIIGTRDVPTMTRRAPEPAFGRPPGASRVPDMYSVLTGRPNTNAQVADAIEAQAPELAAVIRGNFPEGPSSSSYNYQPGLDFRFPAGSQNLVPTTSTRGRVTPAGTNVGGRPYTPESMASPRNVETTRIAGTERLVDLPDAPARIPQGQQEIDFRSTRQILGGQPFMRAPGVRGVGPSSFMEGGQPGALVRSPGGMFDTGENFTNIPVDVQVIDPETVRTVAGVPDVLAGRGVRFGNLGELFSTLTPEQKRTALGLTGASAGIVGVSQLYDAFKTPQEQASTSLDLAAQPSSQAVVNPSTTPLAADPNPPGTGVVLPDAATTAQPTRSLTPEESAALNNYQSTTLGALQQSAPVAGAIASAMAPRDPSYYTPERGGIEQYYIDRANYVRMLDSGALRQMTETVMSTAQDAAQAQAFEQWAEANPTLAYELVNRMQNANPNANQQSGQSLTSSTLGSTLGTDNAANAQGQGETAAAKFDVERIINTPLDRFALNQGYGDLYDAARAIQYPRLQRTQDFARDVRLGQSMGAMQ